MPSRYAGRIIAVLGLALLIVAVVVLLRPPAVPVDLATVETGPLAVTVEEEARTRVRDVYTVSAPVAGRVMRTPLRVGDAVTKGETVLVTILPTPSGLIDERTRAALTAALNAADAAVALGEHEIGRLEAQARFARAELDRTEALAQRSVISPEALERAQTELQTSEHALAAARADLAIRRNRRAEIAAQLEDPPEDGDAGSEVRVEAPVSGKVLRILQESEAVVPAGTTLVEVGDPRDLEVVADLLSTDAVHVDVGAPASIVDWGGPPLEARVTEVEPVAFPKISALGIEELRVRVVLEITARSGALERLGHGYRVTARIVLWQAEEVIKVPVAALFRNGPDWAVFVLHEGRARMRTVEIGETASAEAQVLGGLEEGERVVLYPSDRVKDASRLVERVSR